MPTAPNFLRDFSCFRDLSDEQLNLVAQITDAICYPPGRILFEEDKPGDRLFILVEGNVEVLYNIGESGEVCVDRLWGEEIAGCSALIEPYTYTATERSLTNVEVLEIDAVALRELMQKDHHLGFLLQQHVIRVLMKRILDLRLRAPL